ncbi:hypothetical protein ACIQ34_15490 [Ureibacillus sp. NPDC094379]
MSDRFGRKIFLFNGISILTVVTFIVGFVEGYEILHVIRILQAIAAAAFVPISLFIHLKSFLFEKRLSAFGMISSVFLSASVPMNITIINANTETQRGSAILFNAFILFVGASLGPL